MIPEPSHSNITVLLEKARLGDEEARCEAYDAVYNYLLQLARVQQKKHGKHEALKSKELVHEAYLKLERLQKDAWEDRGHFFAVASTAMRQIIYNQARDRLRIKRGGDQTQVAIDDELLIDEHAADELVSLHDALVSLEKIAPRWAHVVECRFFGGLTVQETSEALCISSSTVKRDYKDALSWLYNQLGEPETP